MLTCRTALLLAVHRLCTNTESSLFATSKVCDEHFPNSVVLTQSKLNASVRQRVSDSLRTSLRTPIDYFQKLSSSLPWYPAVRRERVAFFLSHNPFLLGETDSSVVVFPERDTVDATPQMHIGRFISAATLGASSEVTGFRNGGLCCLKSLKGNTQCELHLHKHFKSEEDVLGYLKSIGIYLPCICYNDEMCFQDDVLEAIEKGRVVIDPAFGCTDRHVESINNMWGLGFDLELKGLDPSQVPLLRVEHGHNEAILIGQRLLVEYNGSTKQSNGAVCLDVTSMKLIPRRATAMGEICEDPRNVDATLTDADCAKRLLRHDQDFPQKVTGHSAMNLLNVHPQKTASEIAAVFNNLAERVRSTSEKEHRREHGKGFSQCVVDTQQLCVTENVRGIMEKVLEQCAPQCVSARATFANKEVPHRDKKRALASACDSYVSAVSAELVSCILRSQRAALDWYHQRKEATSATSPTFVMPPVPGLSDGPFYDGVLFN